MCYYIVKVPRKKTNKTKNTRDNVPGIGTGGNFLCVFQTTTDLIFSKNILFFDQSNAPSGVIPVHAQHNITTYNSENFHNKHMYSGGTKNLK